MIDWLIYFYKKKIKFNDISKLLLKVIKSNEFKKFKYRVPQNLREIKILNNYVSLKIHSLSV